MVQVIRRKPLQATIGGLLALGLIWTGLVASRTYQRAAVTGCGYGYDTGYGYGYGYGSCTPASSEFAEGRVFDAVPGQQLTVHGSAGVGNADGEIVQDPNNSTHESSAQSSSGAQSQVLTVFTTDSNGNF